MIWSVAEECLFQFLAVIAFQDDTNFSEAQAERGPFVCQNITGQVIQSAKKRSGLKVDVFVPFFESV